MTLILVWLSQLDRFLLCLCFAVVSEELAEFCKGFVTSVVNQCDVVPRLSCASVESLLVDLVKASPAKKAMDNFFDSATKAIQNMTIRYALWHMLCLMSAPSVSWSSTQDCWYYVKGAIVRTWKSGVNGEDLAHQALDNVALP